MRILILITCLFCAQLLGIRALAAQRPTEDSTWLLDTLDEKNYPLVEPKDIKYSYGWFPEIIKPFFSIYVCTGAMNTWDEARGINSKSLFAPASGGFNSDISLDNTERTIKKPFSLNDEDVYPTTSYFSIYAGFETRLMKWAYVYGNLGYLSNCSILASNDYSKSYLGRNGGKVDVKEANIIYLNEKGLYYGIGLSIPFYGAFLSAGDNIASLYCLNLGLGGAYKFSSRATQYLQLANNKDEVRFKNGTDTLRLIDEATLPNINRSRFFVEIGLSMKSVMSKALMDFGFVYALPLTRVLDDANWKQHGFRIYVSIGYSNVF